MPKQPVGLEAVRYDIMWNRLIAVVQEQATTLVRSAFSTSTREAGDLSAGLFDIEGQMLAQSVTGTPGPCKFYGELGKAFSRSISNNRDGSWRCLLN